MKIRKLNHQYWSAVKNGIENVRNKSWLKKYNNITWTEETWNAVWGCKEVSPGCLNCYARVLATSRHRKFGQDQTPKIWVKEKDGETAEGNNWGMNWRVEKGRWILDEAKWDVLFKWNAKAEKNNSIMLVFVGDMNDLFEDHSVTRRELKKLWEVIAETPYIHYQFLTKRPENIRECLPDDWDDWTNGYPNVWLGCSVENSDYVKRFNDHLAHIPAIIKFISYEPALGPLKGINWEVCDWVIVGGESGNGYREMDLDWASDVRDQVKDFDTTFFFKQSSHRQSGKGTKLDDVQHYNFPLPMDWLSDEATVLKSSITATSTTGSTTSTSSTKETREDSEFIKSLKEKHAGKKAAPKVPRKKPNKAKLETGTSKDSTVTLKMSKATNLLGQRLKSVEYRQNQLDGILPTLRAKQSAERAFAKKLTSWLKDGHADPEEELKSIEAEEVQIWQEIDTKPAKDLTDSMIVFLQSVRNRYSKGMPKVEKKSSRYGARKKELNPRQETFLKDPFLKVMNGDWQSNDQIQEAVLKAIPESLKGKDAKFCNTSISGIKDENGEDYSYKGNKTLRELFGPDKPTRYRDEFTSMTFRMHCMGLIEMKTEKFESGGNRPLYRQKQN